MGADSPPTALQLPTCTQHLQKPSSSKRSERRSLYQWSCKAQLSHAVPPPNQSGTFSFPFAASYTAAQQACRSRRCAPSGAGWVSHNSNSNKNIKSNNNNKSNNSNNVTAVKLLRPACTPVPAHGRHPGEYSGIGQMSCAAHHSTAQHSTALHFSALLSTARGQAGRQARRTPCCCCSAPTRRTWARPAAGVCWSRCLP